MRALAVPILLLQASTPGAPAAAPDQPELVRLLGEFLAGASRNDPATHERFWAEDLVYTGSSGRRRGKAEVLADVRAAPRSAEPETTYSAEDVRVQQYGDAAIVAFRLVGTTRKDGRTHAASYLNTGTFVRRNGKWQAAGWQATRVPRAEDEAKREAAAAQAAFHRALLAADVKALGAALDEGFVWTHSSGERQTRRELLDQIGAGTLRYSTLEVKDPAAVSVHGEAAVVRGESLRQRSARPGHAPDPAPFTVAYTSTLVSRGGEWLLVALHTSRPPAP
jgi:ketosteroid isomerase-like protein